MADAITELALALSGGGGVQQQIAAENPYLNLLQVPDTVSSLITNSYLKNPSGFNVKEALIPTLASGLLSGFLTSQGNDYSKTLLDRYQNAVSSGLGGRAPDPNAYLPSSLLSSANTAANVFATRRGLEEQVAKLDQDRKITGQIQLETNPDILRQKLLLADVQAGTISGDEALQKLYSNSAPSQIAAQVNNARVIGQNTDGSPILGGVTSNEQQAAVTVPSQLQRYAEQLGVQIPPGASLTREKVEKISAYQKAQKDKLQALEKDYYGRITDLPAYKQLADIEPNFKAALDLAKKDDKASDIGLISTVSRIRDPNSTVREGEYKINADTQSYLDSLYGDWRAVVTGKSRLSKQAKQNIIESIVPKYNQTGQAYLDQRAPLLAALDAQGGDSSNVPVLGFSPYKSQPIMDIASFIADAKRNGLSKEQAKAQWQALGGQ